MNNRFAEKPAPKGRGKKAAAAKDDEDGECVRTTVIVKRKNSGVTISRSLICILQRSRLRRVVARRLLPPRLTRTARTVSAFPLFSYGYGIALFFSLTHTI